jgi:hypothetical protein
MTKKDEKEVTSLTNVKLVTPSESLTPLALDDDALPLILALAALTRSQRRGEP